MFQLLALEAILLLVLVLDYLNRVWVVATLRVVCHLNISVLAWSGSKDGCSISFQIPIMVVVLGHEKTDGACGRVVSQVECWLWTVQDKFLGTSRSLSGGHFIRLTVVRGSFVFGRVVCGDRMLSIL